MDSIRLYDRLVNHFNQYFLELEKETQLSPEGRPYQSPYKSKKIEQQKQKSQLEIIYERDSRILPFDCINLT